MHLNSLKTSHPITFDLHTVIIHEVLYSNAHSVLAMERTEAFKILQKGSQLYERLAAVLPLFFLNLISLHSFANTYSNSIHDGEMVFFCGTFVGIQCGTNIL